MLNTSKLGSTGHNFFQALNNLLLALQTYVDRGDYTKDFREEYAKFGGHAQLKELLGFDFSEWSKTISDLHVDETTPKEVASLKHASLQQYGTAQTIKLITYIFAQWKGQLASFKISVSIEAALDENRLHHAAMLVESFSKEHQDHKEHAEKAILAKLNAQRATTP